MKDFTVPKYLVLLDNLQAFGFTFQTYADFCSKGGLGKEKIMLLRHDVDARKHHSLRFARLQNYRGIKGTYYFRTIPASFDEEIIREIHELGHEVGYHYETMDTAKGNVDKAYDQFCFSLEKFRQIVPVKTICMHGSPLSRFDNREIWKKYDYRALGIIAEPYFDIDFNSTFYLTDTGRRWNGSKMSVRDKVMPGTTITNRDFLSRNYHATDDIIADLRKNDFPSRVMMNFHPQRWTENRLEWWQELILQNLKNQLKKFLIKF